MLVLLLHVKHQLPRDSTLIPAFHAVTGCDIVSQFAGHGKVTAWKAFKQNSQLLTSLASGELTEEIISSAEAFDCKIYEPLTELTNIDQMRVYLFNKGKDAGSLLPLSDALKLHIKSSPLSDNCMAECNSSVSATVPSPNLWMGA